MKKKNGLPHMNVVPLRISPTHWSAVELFSGCGGLSLGLARAGFRHEVLVEWDHDACETLRHNKRQGLLHVRDWEVQESDVRNISWTAYKSRDLVAGGPPCQPFSMGGKAEGQRDERDMWPEAIRAVAEVWPKAFLFENVRGLLRPAFSSYVGWIKAALSRPDLELRTSESIQSHLVRLETHMDDAPYEVVITPINAADFGTPQRRHRVIIMGVRKDLGIQLSFPRRTHSYERLIWNKWVTGEYWERHRLKAPRCIPSYEQRILSKLRTQLIEPTELPWVTCRDAFDGLREPGIERNFANHNFQDGARSYPGHTGSPIDEPAKALKAGVHGVPGGENMLLREDGSVRYFSVREAARLQGLPDDFEFRCSWTESMRQIGNAVPVQLASVLGHSLAGLISYPQLKRHAA